MKITAASAGFRRARLYHTPAQKTSTLEACGPGSYFRLFRNPLRLDHLPLTQLRAHLLSIRVSDALKKFNRRLCLWHSLAAVSVLIQRQREFKKRIGLPLNVSDLARDVECLLQHFDRPSNIATADKDLTEVRHGLAFTAPITDLDGELEFLFEKLFSDIDIFFEVVSKPHSAERIRLIAPVADFTRD